MNKKTVPIMSLTLATFFWGATFVASKHLLQYLTSFQLLTVRFLAPALLLYLFFFRPIHREFKKALSSKMLWSFGLVNFLAIYFQTQGMKYTSASNAGFITAFSVILVPLVLKVHFQRKLSTATWLPLLMSCLGIYFISFQFQLPQSYNFGDFLVFISALCYAYHITLLGELSQKFSGPTIMFSSFLVTSLLASAFSALKEWPHPALFLESSVFFSLLFLIILGGLVPYLLMAYGQKHLHAQLAALIYLLEPIFALLLAMLYLKEMFTMEQFLGSGLILVSLVWAISIDNQNEANNSKTTERPGLV